MISDFDPERVDGASYRLRIGCEVFISPTGEGNDRVGKPKIRLDDSGGFIIPPGQFGLILTEETVEVPKTALALISIRAKYKFRGLINVSGFHVDPGYKGKILFSVYNAGPNAIHLCRGEQCFLIWYADVNDHYCANTKHGHETIPSEFIGPIASEITDIRRLDSRVKTLEIIYPVIITALVGIGLLVLKQFI